nr:unnamed protein product [Callosobruchus analis]CAI5867906.1 unnamed protein product [Callosobruchus analis]
MLIDTGLKMLRQNCAKIWTDRKLWDRCRSRRRRPRLSRNYKSITINHSDSDFVVESGEGIAQLVFEKLRYHVPSSNI